MLLIFMEISPVRSGRFEVELGAGRLSDPSDEQARTSLRDIAAAHPVLQLEVSIDGVLQAPMVEIRPAGHSLKSHLVLSGKAPADDEGPHWKHYEHRGAVSAVESVRLRPSTAKGDGSSKRGPMLGGEFRFLTQRQYGELYGEIIPDDREYEGTRGAFRIKQRGRFNERWSSNVNFNLVSDDEYLEDFGNSIEVTVGERYPSGASTLNSSPVRSASSDTQAHTRCAMTR